MAGLLDFITESAKKQYAKGAPYREAVTGLLQGDTSGFKKLNAPAPVNQNEALDVAMTFAPLGITAYHGSPYNFDKFDLSKVGSGAKSQNYGYGSYFTESPSVAKQYANPDSLENIFATKTAKDLKDAFSAGGISKVNEYVKNNNLQKYSPDINKFFDSTVYKVDIPDENIKYFLDFESPISKQSSEVKAALSPIANKYKVGESQTGKDLYQEIVGEKRLLAERDALFNKYQKEGMSLSDAIRSMDKKDKSKFDSIVNSIENLQERQKAASNTLLNQGILGAKYKDLTPELGVGTNNYVVYDPNIVKILERNGLLLP